MAGERERRRRLTVLLHADVVGSTRLVQVDEGLAHARMTAAFNTLSDTIRLYGGTVLEVRGDALVAELPRASDALAAALCFQSSNAESVRQMTDDVAPVVRIGIALGEVVVADGTVTGPGIVLAQRIEQLAADSGICVTGAVREAAPGRLPFEFEDLGPSRLKGFDDPVNVFAVRLEHGCEVPAPEDPAPEDPVPGGSAADDPAQEGLAAGAPRRTAAPAKAWRVRAAVGGLVVALAVVAALRWWQPDTEPADPARMTFALPDKPSVVVMPFSGGDAGLDEQAFADGLTDDITTVLSRISQMLVIGSFSAEALAKREAMTAEVAEALGVRYVLEGSVQRSGDRFRASAQLLDALSGRLVWGDRYDRRLDDIFAVRDDITREVVNAVQVTLTGGESAHAWHRGTSNLKAYEAALRGQAGFKRFTREGVMGAIPHFERAIELDPGYAAAYVGLGWLHRSAARYGWVEDRRGAIETSFALAAKAVEIDPALASAYTLLTNLLVLSNGDLEQAGEHARRAVALAPNEFQSHFALATVLSRNGRYQHAYDELKLAERLVPIPPSWLVAALASASTTSGDSQGAIRYYRQFRELEPDGRPRYAIYAIVAHARLGQTAAAREELEYLLRRNPDFSLKAAAQWLPTYMTQDTVNELIEVLRSAGLPEA